LTLTAVAAGPIAGSDVHFVENQRRKGHLAGALGGIVATVDTDWEALERAARGAGGAGVLRLLVNPAPADRAKVPNPLVLCHIGTS